MEKAARKGGFFTSTMPWGLASSGTPEPTFQCIAKLFQKVKIDLSWCLKNIQ
jgi:hypothetical protein